MFDGERARLYEDRIRIISEGKTHLLLKEEVDEVQEMRCGNCAAFIQTPEMLDCILKGIDEETDGYAKDVQGAANLGYCELFDLKCAGERTCSAWLSGGPITKKMTKNQQNMLMMAKTEYDMEDEED